MPAVRRGFAGCTVLAAGRVAGHREGAARFSGVPSRAAMFYCWCWGVGKRRKDIFVVLIIGLVLFWRSRAKAKWVSMATEADARGDVGTDVAPAMGDVGTGGGEAQEAWRGCLQRAPAGWSALFLCVLWREGRKNPWGISPGSVILGKLGMEQPALFWERPHCR